MKRRVKIVGAGFSGLATAFWLSKLGFSDISLFERAPDRVGGMLKSYLPAPELGLVECAANGFLANYEVLEMAEAIGVPLSPTQKESRVRLIWRDGKAHQWPLGVLESAELTFALAKSLGRFKPTRHESLDLWAHRELSTAAAKYIVGPALQGVYGTSAKNLNAQLILGSLRKFRTLRKRNALRGSVAPVEGMGAFQTGLRTYLEKANCEFKLAREIIDLEDFKRSKEEIIVVATSLFDAGRLVQSIDADLGARMLKVPSVGLVSATAFFKPEDRHHRAFGCLFPRGEGIEAMGVLLNNFIFPERGPALSETWIFGGEYCDRTSADIQKQILQDRKKFTGKDSALLGLECQFWPRALPLYSFELRDLLDAKPFEEFNKSNIFFIGNYLGAIGLSKIGVQARELAEQIRKLNPDA